MTAAGEEILVNVLALDRTFTDYEFLHVYLGPAGLRRAAEKIEPKRAYLRLKQLLAESDRWDLDDSYPRFRRTYVRDFLSCVLTQVEVFVFKKRRSFAETVVRLMAGDLPHPFALQQELAKLKESLRGAGFTSIAHFNQTKQSIRFATRRQLTDYVLAVIDDISTKLLQRGRGIFGRDLKTVLGRSRLGVVVPEPGDPPCFYRYDGNGHGTLGIALQREFSEAYIRGFVAHEAIPGHHLYYLLKQQRIDQGQSDEIELVDTFYSPENVINEGLAVGADRLYGILLDPMAQLSAQIEKFLHRLLYNAWYCVNLKRRPPPASALALLRRECGFSEETIRRQLRYHTRDARFYTPVYPLGIHYVDQSAGELRPHQLPCLYQQHSINTLRRLLAEKGPATR